MRSWLCHVYRSLFRTTPCTSVLLSTTSSSLVGDLTASAQAATTTTITPLQPFLQLGRAAGTLRALQPPLPALPSHNARTSRAVISSFCPVVGRPRARSSSFISATDSALSCAILSLLVAATSSARSLPSSSEIVA